MILHRIKRCSVNINHTRNYIRQQKHVLLGRMIAWFSITFTVTYLPSMIIQFLKHDLLQKVTELDHVVFWTAKLLLLSVVVDPVIYLKMNRSGRRLLWASLHGCTKSIRNWMGQRFNSQLHPQAR